MASPQDTSIDMQDTSLPLPEWQFVSRSDSKLSILRPSELVAFPGETATETLDSLAITPTVIRNVQFQLNALGFAAGTPDGVSGRRTLDAIGRFLASISANTQSGLSAELTTMLSARISADRARIAWAVSQALPLKSVTYCLVVPGEELLDGYAGRRTMCHLVVGPVTDYARIVTYFDYLRLNDETAIAPVETKLKSLGNGFYIGLDDVEFVFSEDELWIAGVKYRRSDDLR